VIAGADLTVTRGRPLAMEIDERTGFIEPSLRQCCIRLYANV